MSYVRENKDTFQIVGYSAIFDKVGGQENFSAIANMWKKLTPSQIERLGSLHDDKIHGLVGISDEQQGKDTFQYTIGISSTAQGIAALTKLTFPTADWLVYSCKGPIPEAMMALKKELLFRESNKCEVRSHAISRVEVYPQGDMSSSTYESELWIALEKGE